MICNYFVAHLRHDYYIENFRGILNYLIVEYHAIMKSIGKLSSKLKHILDVSQDDATVICKMSVIYSSKLLLDEIKLFAMDIHEQCDNASKAA